MHHVHMLNLCEEQVFGASWQVKEPPGAIVKPCQEASTVYGHEQSWTTLLVLPDMPNKESPPFQEGDSLGIPGSTKKKFQQLNEGRILSGYVRRMDKEDNSKTWITVCTVNTRPFCCGKAAAKWARCSAAMDRRRIFRILLSNLTLLQI
eukprot:gene24149-biopygen9863